MSASLWDKKARNFPRFVKDTQDTLEILDFFKNLGIDFKDKRVLDIGAGNGRFALQIAFLASHVYASDISNVMLQTLDSDAKTLGLGNITSHLGAWEDCDVDSFGHIDIAFASMTPALNNFDNFKKALNVAREGLCYVGWGRVRKSEFLESIFALHNITIELPVGLPQVLQWLEELGFDKPVYCYRDSNYTYNADVDKAIEDVKWNICMHNAIPDENLIKSFVNSHSKDGFVSYDTKREIGLCFIPRKA